MKKFLALIIITICGASTTAFSQGIIRGKITDKNGESVIGAAVVLKNNRGYGTTADFDGNYSLKIEDATPVDIIITFISYKTIEETVNPKNGEVIIKNYVMQSSAQEVKQVDITAKAVKSRDYFMEKVKTNSATTLDYISNETMRRTGDANVTAAVARVPGISTYNGFITVRGIGDRYVKTAVNGSVIPTLDPFTNNIKLDIFPSSLVDNIIITKTASSDLPGDWSGAYLSIETKDYPDALTVTVETSFGYNSQSTFKDFLSSDRSKTDKWGFDSDFRDINHKDFKPVFISPNGYQQMLALGLGNFYSSLGVTEAWAAGSLAGQTYFNLGLVELGLLAPAQIKDPDAIAAANEAFIANGYAVQAFNTINAGGAASGKSLPNNWSTFYRKAPLDFSQSFSIGNQVNVFKRPLGFQAGFRYGSSIDYDPNSIANRAGIDAFGGTVVKSTVVQQAGSETNGWSALLNLNYKLNANNSIGLLFMPNFSGSNDIRDGKDAGTSQTYALILTKDQLYEEKQQLIYQFKSEHFLPKQKIKIESRASFTDGKSSAPDFKTFNYFLTTDGMYVIDGTLADAHRYYRYLTEKLFDSQLTLEMPLANKPDMPRKVKIGGGYQFNDRVSEQFDYRVKFNSGNFEIVNNDIEAFFNSDDFAISTINNNGITLPTINKYYEEAGNPASNVIGDYSVISAFGLADYAFTPRLRISGGLRVEQADIFTDVFKYDSAGYAPNDPRRQFKGEIFTINPGKLSELSLLPSANLIYKIRNIELTPTNLRLNFSQTVARPSMRELSEVVVRDYELDEDVFGNSALKMVQINNYDLRVESYFKNNDYASVSVFYKDFKDHIELILTNQGYSWQNVDKSNVAGIEIEGRKNLPFNFNLGANVTFVESKTEFVSTRLVIDGGVKDYVPVDTVSRTMFGQAPYVINAILNYTNDSLGLSATISYNIQGDKLALTSGIPGVPDVFELSRSILDFKVTKTIGKHFSVNLRVRDILNTNVTRAYKYGDGSKVIYDRYKWGTSYILGIGYKL